MTLGIRWTLVAVGVFAGLAGGCAETRVYSDEALTNRTGVRYYPMAKPVMIVKETDASGAPLAVGVAYLPDTSAPHYVRHQQGLGTSTWTLTCKDGVATGFKLKTDSKVPEAIENLAGAGVAYLAGRQALKELDIIKGD